MTDTLLSGFTPDQLGFDPQALSEKYRQEREKRLRDDGWQQYQDLDAALAGLSVDPFAQADYTRQPLTEDVGVVIIGGGYGGLLAAVRLIQSGVEDIRIIEKGATFGGTWYWNQYPGARCDIESYIYMPLLEELGFMPSEKYATGAEIMKHVQAVDKTWGLSNRAHFQTVVKDATWDEEAKRWVIRTNWDDVFRARHLVTSTGILHHPKIPALPGIDSFKGHSFHTSHFDYAYTGGPGELTKLRDKRVAILGTGATSIQVVPEVAKYAKHLYVFQRTPSSINVRNNRPTDADFFSSLKKGWQQARMENFNDVVAGVPVEEDLIADGWTQSSAVKRINQSAALQDPAKLQQMMELADLQKMELLRKRISDTVTNAETAEKLKPWYPSMCKRPCFHDYYLPTFNRPNVTLVDTDGKGVDRISEAGIVSQGQEYAVDLIIYSTGFASPVSAHQHNGVTIRGRNGLSLGDKWKDGPSTLFAVQTRDFPNYFHVSVLQAGVGSNYMFTLDAMSQHIAYIISECLKRGVESVEPAQEAEDKYVQAILGGGTGMREYFLSCTPSYFNNEGAGVSAKNSSWAAGANAWARLLRDWRKEGKLQGLELDGRQVDEGGCKLGFGSINGHEDVSNGVSGTETNGTSAVHLGTEEVEIPPTNGTSKYTALVAVGLPDFDSLPTVEGMPQGCAWGIFDKKGETDIFGTLNLLEPHIVRAALFEAREGISISLNWPLGAMKSSFRKGLTKKVLASSDIAGAMGCYFDEEVDFNTQCSSQWDSLCHYAHQPTKTFYNGVRFTAKDLDQPQHSESKLPTLEHWHTRGGIVGRGVLIDYKAYAERNGIAYSPFRAHRISVPIIEAIAREQGVTFQAGDILVLRTGYTEAMEKVTAEEQNPMKDENKDETEVSSKDPPGTVGMESSVSSAKWLWNKHFAAVAGDTIGFECVEPFFDETTGKVNCQLTLHEYLLTMFGMPIGELWDLKALSEACAERKKWSFLLTSVPLNIPGSVGSPANALAIF